VNDPVEASIAVVDDDANLREMLSTALQFAGYTTHTAGTCAEGLEVVRTKAPDLIVLDVQLPDGDGFELCRTLRLQGIATPVIFLTARDQSSDVIAGFTDGGDDYVTKPFRLAELSLRITAILRRSGRGPVHMLRLGDIVLDQVMHQVTRGGVPVDLTPKEFDVLKVLMANRGRVVSKSDVVRQAWSTGHVGDVALVETYISRLRTKLGDEEAELIRTIRGRGYAMDEVAVEGAGTS
jgi:two-component system OmpR family response regulator